MTRIKLKPLRRTVLTQREVRTLAYKAATRLCGTLPDRPRTFAKKKD